MSCVAADDRWRDDLGETIEGPKTLRLGNVPLSRLPRYERLGV